MPRANFQDEIVEPIIDWNTFSRLKFSEIEQEKYDTLSKLIYNMNQKILIAIELQILILEDFPCTQKWQVHSL